MKSETSILFVCTGNIFRSMTAEFALKRALKPHAGLHVHSAGLIEAPHEIVDFVHEFHAGKGVSLSSHRPRRLTAEMLADANLTIAMDFEHQHRIEQEFGTEAPLFSEVAFGKVAPMPDVCDLVPDWRNNTAASRAHGFLVMESIYRGIPGLIERLGLSRNCT